MKTVKVIVEFRDVNEEVLEDDVLKWVEDGIEDADYNWLCFIINGDIGRPIVYLD